MASRDADDEIREIKREIIESRGLVIRSHNATSALAADIKSIARRQQIYERRMWINSAVAYLLFTGLLAAGFKLWADSALHESRMELDQLRRQIDRIQTERTTLAGERDQRTALEGRSMAFYQLIREGKRQEVVEGWAALRREPLTQAETAVFTDAVDRFRSDLSLEAFQRGLEHARVGRWVQAYESYEAAIRLKEDAGHAPRVRLAQGEALRHLGRHREAIVVLQPVAEGPDADAADDALLLMAHCQAELQLFGEARTSLRTLMRRFPYGSVANDARLYLYQLSTPGAGQRR